jgi:hypothetical protein
MARVALDGRKHPNDSRRGADIDYLRAGEWVNIRCQITGAGGRLYDRVGDYFVPDEYMRTLYTGRIRARRRAERRSADRTRCSRLRTCPPAYGSAGAVRALPGNQLLADRADMWQ